MNSSLLVSLVLFIFGVIALIKGNYEAVIIDLIFIVINMTMYFCDRKGVKK